MTDVSHTDRRSERTAGADPGLANTRWEGGRLVADLTDPYLYQRNPHDVWEWMRANESLRTNQRLNLNRVSQPV